MEIIRNTPPFAYERPLELLASVFGAEEAALEKPQCDGTEAEFNRDIVYTAEETVKTLGTVHITVPKAVPELAGFSGMCVDPSARGTGIGRLLFEKSVEEADGGGVQAAFLGTNNPKAANLYSSFGFSYMPGSYVMTRFRGTDAVSFFTAYREPCCDITVKPLDAAARIPLIPLFLNEGPGYLFDSNTGIFNPRYVTQRSCMGLFPKYLAVVSQGGKVFQAVSSDGFVGSILSEASRGGRVTADFFCCEGFASHAGEMIRACQDAYGDPDFVISAADTGKRGLLEACGLRKAASEIRKFENVWAKCEVFR